MKKLILGLFLIGSLAYGNFEQKLGIKEIQQNKSENVKIYQIDNNEECILQIIKFNENIDRNKMLNIFEEKFKDLNLKYDTLYSTGVTFYNDEVTQGKIFMVLANEYNDSMVIIYADNYKNAEKFMDYLTLNELITEENAVDLGLAIIRL